MKILIIGQAPPAVEQKAPYDTTLLYDMLNWVGIDKSAAQRLFDFDACTGCFPGFSNNGHALPSHQEMQKHYDTVISGKLNQVNRCILLGKVAQKFYEVRKYHHPHVKWLELIHPSKRNYDRIMKEENIITFKLQQFLFP